MKMGIRLFTQLLVVLADEFSVNSSTGQLSINSAPDLEALSGNTKKYLQLKGLMASFQEHRNSSP